MGARPDATRRSAGNLRGLRRLHFFRGRHDGHLESGSSLLSRTVSQRVSGPGTRLRGDPDIDAAGITPTVWKGTPELWSLRGTRWKASKAQWPGTRKFFHQRRVGQTNTLVLVACLKKFYERSFLLSQRILRPLLPAIKCAAFCPKVVPAFQLQFTFTTKRCPRREHSRIPRRIRKHSGSLQRSRVEAPPCRYGAVDPPPG